MFDLIKSIEEWRQEMLAAGIETPMPLEELECHLREDIERQIQSGTGEQQAFESAVTRIGRGSLLRAEFAKNEGLPCLPSDNNSSMADRVLGVLWLAGCLWSLITLELWFIGPITMSDPPDIARFPLGNPPGTTLFLFNGLAVAIYMAGIVGGAFLFRGAQWGRRIVRTIALLILIACVGQMLHSAMPSVWRVWCSVIAVFCLASIWLLNTPRVEPKPNEVMQ